MRTPEVDAYERKLELMAKGLYEEETGFLMWWSMTEKEKDVYRKKVRAMYPNPYPDKKPVVEIEIATDEELENMKKNANKKRRTEMTLVSGVQPVPQTGAPTLKDLVAKAHLAEQGQYTRVEEIDPPLAKVLLEGNTGNRSLSTRLVASLARDIRAGRWKLTHQGLALSKEGRLLDGQHRLAGIVAADMSVRMNVTYNVDPSAFEVIDVNNRPRSHADIIRLTRGEEFGGGKMNQINGAVKIIARFGGTPSSTRWTTSELNRLLDVFGKDTSRVAHLLAGAKGLGKAPVIAALAFVYPLHPVFVENFASNLKSRVGLSENQAAVLRAIERMDATTDQTRARLALVVLRAVKAELAGEQYKSFTAYRDDISQDPAVKHFTYHRGRMGLGAIPEIAHGNTRDA